VTEVRRTEEMLRKLRYMEKQITEANVVIPKRELDYNAPLPGEIRELEVLCQVLFSFESHLYL
jgi:hypothetical protein